MANKSKAETFEARKAMTRVRLSAVSQGEGLRETVEKNEEAKMVAMTEKTRLGKKLAYLMGQKLEAAERELAAITRKR